MASQGDNPSLGDLPPEIFINVLEACPSPQALRALALTSRNFYELFKGSEERLTSMVMQRMIHPSVQHDAAIAARAARLPPDDPDSRCNNRFWVGIAEPVPAGPSSSSRARPPVSLPPPVVWNLAGALVAVRIHEAVCYFSDRLLADLLRRRPFVDAEGRPTTGADWPPTPTEISRIQSALYRFQTLCELFKRQQEGDARPSLNSWLRRSPQLAAPQMEQLCIINDLLMSLVAKAFNNVALHDISWGYFKVPLMASETNKHGQYILSQGLPLLQELVSATSFDARRTILRFGKVPDSADDGPPASLPKFMVDRITRLTPGPFLNPVAFLHDVNNMSDQSRERLRWPAFNPDPDPGPVSLWEWVHFGSMGFVGIYMVHQLRHFRQWGYLFWDMSRLRCLDVFRPGWEDEGKSPSDLFTPYWEYDIVSLELSWHRRRKFWEAGKRGYWEAGDENLGVLPGEE